RRCERLKYREGSHPWLHARTCTLCGKSGCVRPGIEFASANEGLEYRTAALPPTVRDRSVVQIAPYTVALPVTVVICVVPRTMMSPVKSKLPWIVNPPLTIRMPEPLALPAPLIVV